MTYDKMKVGKIYENKSCLRMVLAKAKTGKCIVLVIASESIFLTVQATYDDVIGAKETTSSSVKIECIGAIFEVAETYGTLLKAVLKWDEHI
jgi:hypothetical protein